MNKRTVERFLNVARYLEVYMKLRSFHYFNDNGTELKYFQLTMSSIEEEITDFLLRAILLYCFMRMRSSVIAHARNIWR